MFFSHLKNLAIQTRGLRTTQQCKNWLKSMLAPELSNIPPYDHIIQIGDPRLRQVSDPVPADLITSNEIKYLIKKMRKVYKDYDLVGLASPQIGINLRVIIMEFEEKLKQKFSEEIYKTKEMETLPETVIINPELKILDYEKKVFEEGCGSIRGYAGEVERYQKVLVTGFDENAKEIQLTLNGWNARIAQHEIDHLNGILYTDIMDRKTFKCTSWEVVNVKKGRVVIPFSPDK